MKNDIDLICPECGEPSVYRAGTAYWDAQSQSWQLSDAIDPEHHCGACGASDINGNRVGVCIIESVEA